MIANENIKNVAIYLRLSRDEENKGIESILENHRNKLTELCQQNKWKYEIFQEIASSRTIELREQLVDMLEHVKRNHYDAVVVMDVDRLSRNEFDAPQIFKILSDSNTVIVTPTKTYDWSRDEDNLLLGIQSLVAAQEYKQIKKRMTSGKRSASEKGLWVHGIPPLGYDKDSETRKLVPNEDAKHVKFIFDSIVNGKTVSDVYHELNKMGVKTRTNSTFAFNSVVRIINNEAYKGTIVSNKYLDKNAMRPKDEWHYVENVHPAIVDEATWEKANKIVNTYSFSAPRSRNKIYPTTKLIFCGNCGRVQGPQMAGTGKMYLKVCQRCKNRTFLYEPILKFIKERVKNRIPDVLKQITEIEQKDNSAEIEYKKQQIQKKMKILERAIEKIKDAYELEEYTPSEFKERKAKREDEIKQLKAELGRIEQQNPKDKIADLIEIKKRIEHLLQTWQCLDGEGLTDEEVNRNLHFIIERIIWTYGKSDETPHLNIVWKTDESYVD
ncbi:recombinase family protein [Bacillus cereus group sp. TH153LC]|uniref:recombinase family protein n=1 Tax=Bacillus cereus group sp. TH153LC TaxID=3018059 RepID=UPI0022DEB9E3|nr:recombinase family protein [Bacillus cereus group sp. TH153LC]MDA1660366.1 recombinase family protein [Bacillus cereus group sp. TH153LC]